MEIVRTSLNYVTLLLLVVYSTDALNKTIAKANKKEGANNKL